MSCPYGSPVQSHSWWSDAVVYELYPRSFADANDDGVGDIQGAISRLDYLVDLGVDAIWVTPWYKSPLADGGYDVASYREIATEFGTIDDAEALISAAGERGIKVIVDIVPNHISDQHPWFQAALAAGPGSPERDRFWFVHGVGDTPPNDWVSEFGGVPWTQIAELDGSTSWYLHLFSTGQPDLNWNHPDVSEKFLSVLRFWFDRGVAGIRIDSAALLTKDPELASMPTDPRLPHPFKDRDDVHEIYRSWRALAEEYDPPRALIGEVWVPETSRSARYIRDDEMHSIFNFDLLTCPWEACEFAAVIDMTLDTHDLVGASPTWVLSNHDVTRPVTRYGREHTGFSFQGKTFGVESDLAVGDDRARAAIMLVAALPGSLYIFQGEELGLPEVEDLPLEVRQDPIYLRSGGTDPGRDGCRVPLPWSAASPSWGFSAGTAAPWLPQPASWADYTVERQSTDPGSMLALYKAVIARRREIPQGDDLVWIQRDPHVLAFRRGHIACVVNFSDDAVSSPVSGELLLASHEPIGNGAQPRPVSSETLIPGRCALWIRVPL